MTSADVSAARSAPAGVDRIVRVSVSAVAGVLALLVAPETRATPSATGTAQAVPTARYAYTLTDTWADAAWALTPGRYRHASDVSSAPDGTTFVLDAGYNAVHVIAPDGTPRAVWVVPVIEAGMPWIGTELDVGADGEVALLRLGPGLPGQPRSRVDRFAADGTRLAGGFTSVDTFADVAVGPGGRVYVSVAESAARVDVFGPTGDRFAAFGLSELHQPRALDVAADGTVYVVDRVPSDGAPAATATPGPSPTPRPSGFRRRPIPAVPEQDPPPSPTPPPPTPTPEPGATEGIAIFDPDFTYRRTAPFTNARDVAVGPGGVFVAREYEIFALGDADPIWSAPYAASSALYGTTPVYLDAPVDGRLVASLWHCFFQGLAVFDDPTRRPLVADYRGGIDRPPLEGPIYPARIAAGDGLAVLQGRFSLVGDRPGQSYHPAANAPESEPQSVQRWSAGGRLVDQLGVCAGDAFAVEAGWAVDVAVDGGVVYTADPNFVQRRAGPNFPEWIFWPGAIAGQGREPFLAAAAAGDGHIAAVDVGLGQVIVLDPAGDVAAAWPWDGSGGAGPVADAALPVDIAVGDDRVYLAESGQARVSVRRRTGERVATWDVRDQPLRVAAASGGGIVMLGRGGWAYRYTADGALAAAWRMPDDAVEPLDIAADGDGRVFIGFVRREPLRSPRGNTDIAFTEAGVWVFTPAPAPPAAPPPTAGCFAWPDKAAAPPEIPLGDTVLVTLGVDGACPPAVVPAQVMFVVDGSASMSGSSALPRARQAVLDLAQRLPDAVEVGLVTFGDAAALAVPPGRDRSGVAARMAALTAAGDTRMGEGIALAHTALAGARRRPPIRQVIVVVTDGGYRDDPLPAAAAARADGVDVFALVTRTDAFMGVRSMAALTGDRVERVVIDPDRWALADLAGELSGASPEDGLFEDLTIRDLIPANMRYVAGSAEPPAAYDAASHALTWTLGAIPAADGVRLRYRLQPLQTGEWPTNVEAVGTYRDAAGHDGRLVFPVPRIRVLEPGDHRAFLPIVSGGACLRSEAPLDVVLVLDASQSMGEPAGGGRSKLEAARAAAGVFVDALELGRDAAAVVGFNDRATRWVVLTDRRAALDGALAALAAGPGTRIDRGLAEARRVLADGGRAGAQPVVVLLTDGLQDPLAPVDAVRLAADGLKRERAHVSVIGLGEAIDRDLLRAVASTPGDFHESPTADGLVLVFEAIRRRVACLGP